MAETLPKWRTGRRKARNIYLQPGPTPTDEDPQIGCMDTGEYGELVVAAVNGFNDVLRIVSAWCIEANDVGGVDAGDLSWRLEQAGYPLPDEEADHV